MSKIQRPPSPSEVVSAKKTSHGSKPVILNGYDAWMPNLVTLGSTRKLHDSWNMVMLPLIALMTLQHLIFKTATTYQPWLILAYFAVDTSWMLVDPGAVRSPFEIFSHHLACLVLSIANTSVPFIWDSWSYAVIVEFNTVFLVGQRMVGPGWAQYLMRLLCVLTWIPCRATPMVAFTVMGAQMYSRDILPVWLIVALFTPVAYLTYLQVAWTQRMLKGPIISDVVDATFGTKWGEKRRKDGGKDDTREGL